MASKPSRDVGSRISMWWADSCKTDPRMGRRPRCHSAECMRDSAVRVERKTPVTADDANIQLRQQNEVTPTTGRSGGRTRSGIFSCFRAGDEFDAMEIKHVTKSFKKFDIKKQKVESKRIRVELDIQNYLRNNPKFVDNYIIHHVSASKLDDLIRVKKAMRYLNETDQTGSEITLKESHYNLNDSVSLGPMFISGGSALTTSYQGLPKIDDDSRKSITKILITAPEEDVMGHCDRTKRIQKSTMREDARKRRQERSRSLEIERRRLSQEKASNMDLKPSVSRSPVYMNVAKNPRRASDPPLHDAIGADLNESFSLELLSKFNNEASEQQVLRELASTLYATLHLDAFRIFKAKRSGKGRWLVSVLDKQDGEMNESMNEVDDKYQKMITTVAVDRKCKRLAINANNEDLLDMPYRLLKSFGVDNIACMQHVMFVPILNVRGKTINVIEMWRKYFFNDCDEEIASLVTSWSSVALHYCGVVVNNIKEKTKSDFLIHVAKCILTDLGNLTLLIKTILEFAQRLVSADRASLFLIDYKTNELVSSVFDLKINEEKQKMNTDKIRKEIRMPLSKGIAGYVASFGETVNINDAYADKRFNSEVDESTGYKTRTILCMPIKVEGSIIGVVQMVNKISTDQKLAEEFSREDEYNFETFSTFFGLALQQARLYDRIKSKEQKYKVAIEVLGYHNTSKEEDVEIFLSETKDKTTSLVNFYLNPFGFDPDEKCKAALTMFDDLFSFSNYDKSTFTRFVLTVRKNYRNVPYHNFNHGWSVAHSMYMMLKSDTSKQLDTNARMALFIAALCHDLDHRGFTNKFMIDSKTPLAAMYSTSTLEHHHFNITVTLLHQKGHNFLAHVGKDDFKTILNYIRKCILATDLASFFPNLTSLKTIVEENDTLLDWTNTEHRDLVMALSMTAADLSASTKPWDVQIKTVEIIFDEFYNQGDIEKKEGRQPIATMDRTKPKLQSPSQVEFLKHICLPCYDMLGQIMPETMPMLMQAKNNYEKWQAKAESSLKADSSVTEADTINNISSLDSPYLKATEDVCSEKETFTWDTD